MRQVAGTFGLRAARDVHRLPPVEGLCLLEKTLLSTDDDREALRQAGVVLSDQVEDVVNALYGFVASNPIFWPTSPVPTDSLLAATWRRFAGASGNGFGTGASATTTNRG